MLETIDTASGVSLYFQQFFEQIAIVMRATSAVVATGIEDAAVGSAWFLLVHRMTQVDADSNRVCVNY
jgi:hypothetical protein